MGIIIGILTFALIFQFIFISNRLPSVNQESKNPIIDQTMKKNV